MRNGIYRSWFKGPNAQGESAIILLDGKAICSDPGHTYYGPYTDKNGIFHAEVHAKRHSTLPLPAALADLDEFDFFCEGTCSKEAAHIRCIIPQLPGVIVEIEMIWIGEI